jgi:hypothetical protein
MSWGKRRGVSTTSRVADQDRSIVGKRIDRIMRQRRAILAPFPFVDEDVFWSLYDPAVVDRVRFLYKHMPNVLHRDTDFTVEVPLHGKERTFVRFYLRDGSNCRRALPMPNVGYSESEFKMRKDNQFYDGVVEWAGKFRILTDDWNRVRLHADSVMSTANTLGQARRLWPELAEFFTRQQLDRAPMQKTSPMPEGCYHYDYDDANNETKKLKSEFEPGFTDPLNLLITEALMLPHPDLNEEQDTGWMDERITLS